MTRHLRLVHPSGDDPVEPYGVLAAPLVHLHERLLLARLRAPGAVPAEVLAAEVERLVYVADEAAPHIAARIRAALTAPDDPLDPFHQPARPSGRLEIPMTDRPPTMRDDVRNGTNHEQERHDRAVATLPPEMRPRPRREAPAARKPRK